MKQSHLKKEHWQHSSFEIELLVQSRGLLQYMFFWAVREMIQMGFYQDDCFWKEDVY